MPHGDDWAAPAINKAEASDAAEKMISAASRRRDKWTAMKAARASLVNAEHEWQEANEGYWKAREAFLTILEGGA